MKKPYFGDLIGIPFVRNGRDIKLGLDCWGLLMEVHRRFGNKVPDVSLDPAQILDIQRATRSQIDSLWQRVEQPAPAVSVVMAIDHDHPHILSHFGTFIDENNILHAQQRYGSILSRYDIMRETMSIRGLYRFVGCGA